MASPDSFLVSSSVSSPVPNLILPPNYKTRFAKTGASASAGAGAGTGTDDVYNNSEITAIKNAISKYRPNINLTKNDLIKLLKKLKKTNIPINLSDPKEVFRFIKKISTISTINNVKRHVKTVKKNKRMNLSRPKNNAKISNLAILYNSFNSFNSNNLYK